ncbi:MAG: Molybdenum cofactor guanylyltransferase [Bacteroidia bacterium]|nr:Molybdenum cofactor guanylyltransferase [Bacteroidia bacterium]
MTPTYGALILAGGKSERMNYPKPYLIFENKTFLLKIIESYYKAGVKNICLVINQNFCSGKWKNDFEQIAPLVRKIEQTDPEKGRFHSIKLGIKNLLNTDYVFIQNADNPFITNRIIKSLKRHRLAQGYTQLFCEGHKGHPILISKRIVSTLNDTPGDEHNLRTILSTFPKTDLETEDARVLANLNTRDEYEKFIPANR